MSTLTRSRSRPAADSPAGTAPEHLRRFGGGAVGPFAQMLLVGLLVCAASLPLITFIPALAAGRAQLEAHLNAEDDSITAFWERFRGAIQGGGWAAGAATGIVIGLLVVNISGALQGLMPASTAVAVVSIVLALAILVIASRAAALWAPRVSWRDLVPTAAELSLRDMTGTLSTLTGYAVAAVVVWMLTPLVVIAPGLIALALTASERRRRNRS